MLRHEVLLLVVLIAEFFYFNAVGRRFGSVDNLCDIVRHSTWGFAQSFSGSYGAMPGSRPGWPPPARWFSAPWPEP